MNTRYFWLLSTALIFHWPSVAEIIDVPIRQEKTFFDIKLPEKPAFNDETFFSVNRAIAKISEDGRTLRFHKDKSFRFQHLFHTRPGRLKQNTIYTISFFYRLNQEAPSKAFLNFHSRSSSSPHIHPLLKFNETSRKGEKRTVQLITRDDADQYIFSADLYHSASGEISDFSIRETGIADNCIKIHTQTTPYAGKLPPLPTGCPEFEVKLPDTGNEMVNAADFGLSTTSSDNTAAFQKALEYCREKGTNRLVFPRGTYRFSGSVQIRDLKNLEIDGSGSLFLYYRELKGAKENIIFRNCNRVRFRNFNFDWDWGKMPLGSLVEVVNVCGDEIDFRFCDYDYYPKRDVRVAMVSEMDPTTRRVTVENKAVFHFEFYLGHYAPKNTWLSGNVLRVKDRGNNWNREHLYFFRKGQFFRMLHAYYEGGMFLAEDCTDFSFEDLNIYSTTGKNFHFQGMKNWQLLRVRCAPPKDRPERVVSSTADGYGHERCYGNFKMEDCVFTDGNDDFLNIQDNSIYASRFSPVSLATVNYKGPLPSKGDVVELRDANYKTLNFKAKVIATKEIDTQKISEGLPWGDQTKKTYEIVLDSSLPENSGDAFVVFNLKFNSGNAIFRRCRFENTDGSGRFQASNVTIEDCIFRNNASSSLHFATGYTLRAWNEGYGIDNLVVRNCIFDTAAGGIRNIAAPEADCKFNVYTAEDIPPNALYPVFRNILIENNTFTNSCGMIASIAHASNITIRNNRFINTLARKRQMSYRGAIQVINADHIYIVNNQYQKTEAIPPPAVFYDRKNVKELIVEGNAAK